MTRSLLGRGAAFCVAVPLSALVAQVCFGATSSPWRWLGPGLVGVVLGNALLLLQSFLWAIGVVLASAEIVTFQASGRQMAPRLVLVLAACFLIHAGLDRLPAALPYEPALIGAASAALVLLHTAAKEPGPRERGERNRTDRAVARR